jgi:hypothetical protein
MKNPVIFIISIFTANLLTADRIDDAKTKIKSGDFAEASGYIASHLIENPGDARAYTYKCISDVGIFFEDTLPNYLISNFNANSPETLESFDYDPTKQEIEPTEIQLTTSGDGMNSVIGYWLYYPEIKSPLEDLTDSTSYRTASIFDMSTESQSKSVFNPNSDGYFYPSNDDSAISFTYKKSNPKQVNFEIDTMYGTGNIKIYLNGSEIGEIYDNSYILYKNVRSDMYGSQIYGSGTIPLYLHFEDKVSFVSEPNYTGSSSGPGIKPSYAYDYNEPEQGIAYNISYPNLGNATTIDDILAVLKRKELPVRELLETLISNLDNFNIGDEVIVDSQFYAGENTETSIDPLTGLPILDPLTGIDPLTGLPILDPLTGFPIGADTYDDIIIQYWDALALKSILGIIESSLGISDQYDIGINYSYDDLSGLDTIESAKSFLSTFTNFLEANPSRIGDQLSAATDLEASLSGLKESLSSIWTRGALFANDADYLIEPSEYSEPGELADLNTSIDSLIQSIDGFDNFSNLTGKSDGGFKYSLAPVLGQSPFALKQAIIDLENSQDASDEVSNSRQIELMKQYGLVSDLLPASFEGNILAIYNSNGSLHKTISVSSDDFDPFSGELDSYNNDNGMGGDFIFDMYDSTTLSYEEPFKGTWQNVNYMSGTSAGTFYYYNSLLDMNSNGIIDRLELEVTSGDPAGGGNKLSYPDDLSAASISAAQSTFVTFLPDSLTGNIVIYKGGISGDNSLTAVTAVYYLTENDALSVTDETAYGFGFFYSSYKYRYENGTEYFSSNDGNNLSGSFIFNNEYSGLVYESGSNVDNSAAPLDFIIYPGHIDLDNDGLADAEELKLEILPDFDSGGNYVLPSSAEIQLAIAEYTPPSHGDDDDENGSNPTNALALTDNDNDNMPDSLENRFGGNPNDGTDAGNTLNVLLNSVYTINQIRDLRPGSTMIEVVDGYAQLGLTLQESYDLNNWVNVSVPITIDPIQADSGTVFYRFKLD